CAREGYGGSYYFLFFHYW
nr:immunoglobulin heavy chain junction region [Macaca mulatta]MOW76932.1 immunoglobulin heavy chain junction region [Macaca mulatta]MOW77011.1 immunoglobulin heavy chain junction region [Macaca mulatta]MOW77291.1 immunoglobulin heavy chain junction region [Macaca mulatta]MOW77430.1 immunoglobulin heavy chain junction region [Macaca mulatta]